ncbi:hypothetical protein [Paenibacillus sp. SYP-B3998]|nr:hypothetical protein [Paenibacillus sp. SYP-B3998]
MNIGQQFAWKDAAKAHEWVESRRSTVEVLLNVRLNIDGSYRHEASRSTIGRPRPTSTF